MQVVRRIPVGSIECTRRPDTPGETNGTPQIGEKGLINTGSLVYLTCETRVYCLRNPEVSENVYRFKLSRGGRRTPRPQTYPVWRSFLYITVRG